jgi:hypothetical protein
VDRIRSMEPESPVIKITLNNENKIRENLSFFLILYYMEVIRFSYVLWIIIYLLFYFIYYMFLIVDVRVNLRSS